MKAGLDPSQKAVQIPGEPWKAEKVLAHLRLICVGTALPPKIYIPTYTPAQVTHRLRLLSCCISHFKLMAIFNIRFDIEGEISRSKHGLAQAWGLFGSSSSARGPDL
jgi:hypothetical protein